MPSPCCSYTTRFPVYRSAPTRVTEYNEMKTNKERNRKIRRQRMRERDRDICRETE